MLAFCKKINLTHNFLLERFLSLDILVLERGPNLESQTWFQIFTITSHTQKNPSISLNLDFLICTVSIIFASLTSGFIVKIKWTNVFLSLPHCVEVWFFCQPPPRPGPAPSMLSCKLRHLIFVFLSSPKDPEGMGPLQRVNLTLSCKCFQLKKIHRKTRQPLFCPTHNC